MRSIPVLISFFFSAFYSLEISGQYIFKGKVITSEGGKALQGVTVSVGKNAVAVTDSNGVFEVNNSKEKDTFYFSHTGYQRAYAPYSVQQNLVIVLYLSNSFLSEIVVK